MRELVEVVGRATGESPRITLNENQTGCTSGQDSLVGRVANRSCGVYKGAGFLVLSPFRRLRSSIRSRGCIMASSCSSGCYTCLWQDLSKQGCAGCGNAGEEDHDGDVGMPDASEDDGCM